MRFKIHMFNIFFKFDMSLKHASLLNVTKIWDVTSPSLWEEGLKTPLVNNFSISWSIDKVTFSVSLIYGVRLNFCFGFCVSFIFTPLTWFSTCLSLVMDPHCRRKFLIFCALNGLVTGSSDLLIWSRNWRYLFTPHLTLVNILLNS